MNYFLYSYKMVTVRKSSLSKKGGSRKRRRSASVSTRARYGPKTARFNRTLIKSNAASINRIKSLMPKPVFCDWEQRNSITAFPAPTVPAGTGPTFITNGRALTNFNDWEACLRQSSVVPEKSSTRVYRMQMQVRYTLQKSYWAQISFFIVSLRKDASNREPVGTNVLNEGTDFVSNRLGISDDPSLSQNPVLNPAIYKVHYARHVTMTQASYLETPSQLGTVNGATTYRKGDVNIKMKLNVRNPRADISWRGVPIAQLPYYNQYFMLIFTNQEGPDGATTSDLALVDTHMICSTMNSG